MQGGRLADHVKLDGKKSRKKAQEAAAVNRVALHVAGESGGKRFLVKREPLGTNRPFDGVNRELEVPTLKGALEPPPHRNFEVTSTDQKDITEFL